jgi:hypothetical protein
LTAVVDRRRKVESKVVGIRPSGGHGVNVALNFARKYPLDPAGENGVVGDDPVTVDGRGTYDVLERESALGIGDRRKVVEVKKSP